MQIVLLFIGAYLLGSFSFSYIITKGLKKEDIRKLGSGNAGATNTLRVIGVGPAIGVLLLDGLKGMIPVWAAIGLHYNMTAAIAAGAMAIIGHNWPIYYGFKGGKGVATTIGVFMVASFIPSLISGIVVILLIAATRYVSLGSIVFMILTPALMFILKTIPFDAALCASLIGVLSIWRHRTNISRLLKGNERKIGH
ncbi:glycerol-3-phosphate 1-O-acyltransferase PlsY [Fictibacillus sp. KU28468]|uniref:glycerol-3-phosphate 1-O-acyltransferase PlsY n=1 Tax=Fictibacillus sp. KU28468 TaxID=2991053 RepID=UPI00223D9626|nr:glycerol-3-phosphate 1-O-acyltransferase PlsY [Fictibacillus sp. KU28468]UZJ80818.1 glycerol-3-phosphate 1-O-acyltransferase PlsY [Fictibacillus sp. KU28468]